MLIGSFFAAMGIKYGRSRSPHAKRRFCVIFMGISWAGLGLLLVLTGLICKRIAEIFPQWLIIVLLSPLLLFL